MQMSLVIDLLGHNMFELNDKQLSALRGNTVSMVFQDPLSALTPVYEVGRQISEVVRIHHPDVSQAKADVRAVELLEAVGIQIRADAPNSIHMKFQEECGNAP